MEDKGEKLRILAIGESELFEAMARYYHYLEKDVNGEPLPSGLLKAAKDFLESKKDCPLDTESILKEVLVPWKYDEIWLSESVILELQQYSYLPVFLVHYIVHNRAEFQRRIRVFYWNGENVINRLDKSPNMYIETTKDNRNMNSQLENIFNPSRLFTICTPLSYSDDCISLKQRGKMSLSDIIDLLFEVESIRSELLSPLANIIKKEVDKYKEKNTPIRLAFFDDDREVEKFFNESSLIEKRIELNEQIVIGGIPSDYIEYIQSPKGKGIKAILEELIRQQDKEYFLSFVVVDVLMPNLDSEGSDAELGEPLGLKLIRNIRTIEDEMGLDKGDKARSCIFAFTGFNSPTLTKQCLDLGADLVVYKSEASGHGSLGGRGKMDLLWNLYFIIKYYEKLKTIEEQCEELKPKKKIFTSRFKKYKKKYNKENEIELKSCESNLNSLRKQYNFRFSAEYVEKLAQMIDDCIFDVDCPI